MTLWAQLSLLLLVSWRLSSALRAAGHRLPLGRPLRAEFVPLSSESEVVRCGLSPAAVD